MEGKINKPLRLTFQDFNFFNFCIRNPLVSLCLFDIRAVHWWLSLVAEVYRLTYAEVCHRQRWIYLADNGFQGVEDPTENQEGEDE